MNEDGASGGIIGEVEEQEALWWCLSGDEGRGHHPNGDSCETENIL